MSVSVRLNATLGSISASSIKVQGCRSSLDWQTVIEQTGYIKRYCRWHPAARVWRPLQSLLFKTADQSHHSTQDVRQHTTPTCQEQTGSGKPKDKKKEKSNEVYNRNHGIEELNRDSSSRRKDEGEWMRLTGAMHEIVILWVQVLCFYEPNHDGFRLISQTLVNRVPFALGGAVSAPFGTLINNKKKTLLFHPIKISCKL